MNRKYKILVVGNYSPWTIVSEGKMPSHHLFGVHQMIDYYENYKTSIRGVLKNNMGYVYFYDTSKKHKILALVDVFIKSFEYDLIFDFMNCVSRYLGMSRFVIKPSKLITILHHPPFSQQLKYSCSDAYIFLDKVYMDMVPLGLQKKRNVYSINWLPDVNWYRLHESCVVEKYYYTFIDNGKTFRDHTLLLKALYNIGQKAVLINNVKYKPSNYIEGGCVDFIELDSPNDLFLLKYLQLSKIVIIPLKNTGRMLGPVGNTSFMDCLALNKPIICSDNVYFSEIVEKEGLGLCYEAGNLNSLIKCLKTLSGSEELLMNCRENIKKYMNKRNIDIYSEEIFKVFTNVLKSR